jgi:hypothetical protein
MIVHERIRCASTVNAQWRGPARWSVNHEPNGTESGFESFGVQNSGCFCRTQDDAFRDLGLPTGRTLRSPACTYSANLVPSAADAPIRHAPDGRAVSAVNRGGGSCGYSFQRRGRPTSPVVQCLHTMVYLDSQHVTSAVVIIRAFCSSDLICRGVTADNDDVRFGCSVRLRSL